MQRTLMADSVTNHICIFCEATPTPLLKAWEPSKYAPADELTAIPESPLFSPRPEFYTILGNHRCSEYTFELLSDMRDLTDLFVARHAGPDAIIDVETAEDGILADISLQDYVTKIAEIRSRLVAMPAASIPGLPTTNDWLYESCRLAAIIYAGALLMRVPFSVAADPTRNPILFDAAALPGSLIGDHLYLNRLTEPLFEALKRSDLTSVWGDLSGVLYWVALVGAVAARIPETIHMAQAPKSASEARAVWIRRWLVMNSTRPLIYLVFQHPTPIIMAQKKLLRVQELISSSSSIQI